MKWPEFIETRSGYDQAWKNLKEDFKGGDVEKFLKGSSLEIFYTGGQMSFSVNDPFSVALSNPDFFINNPVSVSLLELAKEYKAIKDKNSDQAKDVMEDVKCEDIENLEVVDYRVEIIFPTIDMDIIQELKKSKWVDQVKVFMTKASIRVPLKNKL